MVNVQISYRTLLIDAHNVDIFELENGVTLHTFLNHNATHSHTFTATNQKGKTVVRLNIIVNSLASTLSIAVAVLVHGIVVLEKLLIISSTGSHFVEITFRGESKGAPPTYLEELSKLDQFTKAQYIPRNRL